MMAAGELADILVHTEVTRYLDFQQAAGSYVIKNGRVSKVPATAGEALASSLMGIFEKRRMRSFLEFTAQYDENNPATHQGAVSPCSLCSRIAHGSH